jgi:hypothetical protein
MVFFGGRSFAGQQGVSDWLHAACCAHGEFVLETMIVLVKPAGRAGRLGQHKRKLDSHLPASRTDLRAIHGVTVGLCTHNRRVVD